MESIDITGMKFGRLRVIGFSHNRRSPSGGIKKVWVCACDCGNKTLAAGSDLKNGHTQSCGCLRKERTIKAVTVHGMRHTKIYHTWLSMKDRCLNPKNKRYNRYAERGIVICKEWIDSFEPFYEHVSKLPHFGEKGRSLDRINNNGNYEPGNVRWATLSEQANNKERSIKIMDNGQECTLTEYAERHQMSYDHAYYLYRTKGEKVTAWN